MEWPAGADKNLGGDQEANTMAALSSDKNDYAKVKGMMRQQPAGFMARQRYA